ncbi:Sec-independent protein translocase protein TatB [Lichenibacterium dinghuense]|uniref:Sec-independent protein translocase protein TatB n=1 Tax=Lichenibacterium dinghuense TaxID=2895977 RepID=UPI001EFFE213|nr:Sec-independent protein translocase protein TatB [Lichenibacterium sp. 6Y81]
MFDFDASKLLIIGVVALVVIGPKDLPRVLRQVGQMVGKLRRMAAEFQGQFMDAMKEADLADLQKEVSKLKNTASLDVNFNPVHDIKTSIIKSVESTSVAQAPAAGTAANPFGQDPIGSALPAAAETPAIRGAVSALDPDPVFLEPAEAAHHTPAESAGAVHSVDAGSTDAGRRRILVPKRRPPGDRLAAKPAFTGRGRPFLPPRRDPRP